MKKLVALLLALTVVLSCTAAFAALPIVKVDEVKAPWAWYKGDWTPNFDGTHSNSGKTVACEYQEATYGNTTIKACPVCGDINGEKVELCTSRYLKVNRLYDAVAAAKCGMDPASQILGSGSLIGINGDGSFDATDGNTYAYLTNGQYMVRILRMPAESDVAYVLTTCHEIAGVAYEAECLYSYMLPIDGTGLTVKKAYFGSTRDINCETKVTGDGFYFKPTNRTNAFGVFLLVK